METFGNKSLAKTSYKFYCVQCDYGTCKKCNFDIHCCSIKHKNNVLETTGNVLLAKTSDTKFVCDICEKNFKNRSGLWKHKKKCKNEESNDILDILSDKNIILEILKSNSDLKELLIEQGKQMLEMANKVGSNNCNNNTNSHNNTHFNLQFFLNETCKDALNLTDFVEQFKLQLSDLDMIGRVGYTEGMSKLFIKNLNELDVHKRPIHCSDLKREVLYIKDDDKWSKEDNDKLVIKKAIKDVANKNIKQITNWINLHPDCKQSESKKNNQYLNIVMNSMSGGSNEEQVTNISQIVKNVAKVVTIDKV
jgi:hypothetical protein